MRRRDEFDRMSNTSAISDHVNRIRLRKSKCAGAATKLPHQVLRRNERERKRVQQVNLGFIHLRDRVPHSATSKKLSKVETLREATRYIKHLQDLLQGDCDKPFEPLSTNQEPRNFHHSSCLSEENLCPVTNPATGTCHFTCNNESFYYQHPQNNIPYYKSPVSNSMIAKCENGSSNTSPCYTSSSLNFTDTTCFQRADYVL